MIESQDLVYIYIYVQVELHQHAAFIELDVF